VPLWGTNQRHARPWHDDAQRIVRRASEGERRRELRASALTPPPPVPVPPITARSAGRVGIAARRRRCQQAAAPPPALLKEAKTLQVKAGRQAPQSPGFLRWRRGRSSCRRPSVIQSQRPAMSAAEIVPSHREGTSFAADAGAKAGTLPAARGIRGRRQVCVAAGSEAAMPWQ